MVILDGKLVKAYPVPGCTDQTQSEDCKPYEECRLAEGEDKGMPPPPKCVPKQCPVSVDNGEVLLEGDKEEGYDPEKGSGQIGFLECEGTNIVKVGSH